MRFVQRGVTLIEVIVVLSIVAIIATASFPMIQDYSTNSRLREGGSLLLADALFAQTEALKRNSNVSFTVTTTAMRVTDVATGEDLRTRQLPTGVTATPINLVFGGTGRPAVFGTGAQVELSIDTATCSDEYRCPRLTIDGGGGVRMCANKLDCT